MSTKSTLAHDDNYHLYHELFEGGIYLQVTNPENARIEKEAERVNVTVRLPESLLKRLKLDDKQLEELDDIQSVNTSEALDILVKATNEKK